MISQPSSAGPVAIPQRLSHYTTLPGLMGIVESGKVWASNVSFLNDRRELEHGLEASLKTIRQFTKSAKHQLWHTALRRAAKSLEDGQIPNTYAACFCERSDVLSQWRGYGGREQGVSLTFDQKALTSRMRKSAARLYPIVYGDKSTPAKVSTALAAELQGLEDFDFALDEATPAERERAAHKVICRLLPQFKHYGFHDERELRYVVQHDTLHEEVCFRAAGNVLVPYVQLLTASKAKLPLLAVTVGPGRDQGLTQRSLRLYLDKQGYPETKVLLSQVPFRT